MPRRCSGYDLADLVLHHNWLALLEHEPPGPNVDLVLQLPQRLVPGLELCGSDCATRLAQLLTHRAARPTSIPELRRRRPREILQHPPRGSRDVDRACVVEADHRAGGPVAQRAGDLEARGVAVRVEAEEVGAVEEDGVDTERVVRLGDEGARVREEGGVELGGPVGEGADWGGGAEVNLVVWWFLSTGGSEL